MVEILGHYFRVGGPVAGQAAVEDFEMWSEDQNDEPEVPEDLRQIMQAASTGGLSSS
jgi:hypothetical protein